MANRRGLMAVCAVAVAVMLAADIVGAVVVTNRNRVHTPSALKGVLPELKGFVEKTRQLSFTRGVDIFVLDKPAFDAALGGLGSATTDPGSQYQESRFLVGFLKALGLVPADFRPAIADPDASNALLGLYDFAERRILVRAGMPDPLLRRVLVHELTHALDHQHFPIEDIVVDLRTEQGRALQALIEGDARRVDRIYRDQLPPADRAAADGQAEGLAPAPAGAAPFLALLAFPYVAGPDFVQGLVDHGGGPAVDAAFRAPPTTSEEVLHPDRFLARVGSGPVRQPDADGPLLGLGVIGELGLRLVLGETLTPAAAAMAADGWGGDHYVEWSDNERTCVRINLVMDSATDTTEVRAGLRQWATKHPGTDIKLDGDLTVVTRCA